jgi:hypothetical protein
MKFIHHALFTILIFSFTSLQAAQPGESYKVLSPSELKGLARAISAEDPRYNSLFIEAVFAEPSIKTALGFRAYYSKARGYALHVCDMMDGTPIFLLIDKKALFYDPSAEALILFQDVGLIFEVEMQGDELRFVSAFRTREEEGEPEIVNTMKMDLVSVFNKVVLNLKADRNNMGWYILSGETELGNTCVAEIDPSALIPFLKIAFYRKGDNRPLLYFPRLEANKNINHTVFRFPMKELRDKGLNIKTIAADQEHIINLMSLLGKVLFIRSALAFPETRKDLEILGIKESDWPMIEKKDKMISQALKVVFGAK